MTFWKDSSLQLGKFVDVVVFLSSFEPDELHLLRFFV